MTHAADSYNHSNAGKICTSPDVAERASDNAT